MQGDVRDLAAGFGVPGPLVRVAGCSAEGRRPADLGIRLPLCEAEAANTTNGMTYTEAWIPSFVPQNYGLDDFIVNDETKTVTITHNMNRIIVQNAHSKDVVPFE